MVNTRSKFFTVILIAIFLYSLNATKAELNDDYDDEYEDDYDDDEYEDDYYDDEISATFINAGYADLEGDGFKDDIFFKIKIKFGDFRENDLDDNSKHNDGKINERSSKNRQYKLHLKIELVLPSGIVFLHHVDKQVINNEFEFDLILYNHAIEPGWYWGHLTITDNDHRPISRKNSIFFDPPGAGSGGSPRVG